MWERRASSIDPTAVSSAIEAHNNEKQGRRPTIVEIQEHIKEGTVPAVQGEFEALQIAKAGGWEIEALMLEMEERDRIEPQKKGILEFRIKFRDPRHFTWMLVAFASMGGML